MWPTESRRLARVIVIQGDRTLAKRTLSWPASPGRVLRVPWSLFASIDPEGPDVDVSLA